MKIEQRYKNYIKKLNYFRVTLRIFSNVLATTNEVERTHYVSITHLFVLLFNYQTINERYLF